VETTLDARLAVPVDVYLANGFFPPPDSGVRGYTLAAAHMIFMFDGSGTRQYMIAHELTQQTAYDGIGQAASTMLLEGLAMDMEQPYMVRDHNISLDGFARAVLADRSSIPLTSLSDGSVGFLGQLFYRRAYEEAGSFVQFLITTDGMAEFKRVYVPSD
jgi:hypothetical protein